MASVVVIGAGMGGLSAAARLSAQGHQVTVLEQSKRPGGKLETYRREGFAFDTGPSLLTLPAVYRDLFLKTPVRRKGASLEENIDLRGLDTAFGYHWADGAVATIPGSNSNRVAAALGDALGGSAEAQWQRFSRRAADIWSVTRVPFLESPVNGVRDLSRQMLSPKAVRTVAPWQTLRGLARQYFDDPRLVTLTDRYATYTGSDPRRAPAALAVIPFVEQTFGAWHIGGGLGSLADALYQRCIDRDITFRFSAPVTKIRTEARRVSGVVLEGGESLSCDIVISDADAATVYGRLLDDPLAARQARRLTRLTPSLSGFALLLALRGRTPGLQHHTVLFPSNYDEEFDAIFGPTPRLPDDPAIYICSPDDDTMRPEGHEAWFVLVNTPPDDPERPVNSRGVNWRDQSMVERYAKRVLELMARRGLDVRDRILWQEARTPADIADRSWSPGGSIYGSSSNSRRSAFMRPANRSPITGLFLVGGSAHPGGGLPLVGMSAAIVAELIGPA
ncbi:MAG: phytoene desaturase family protein [Actinomycetes bacterium]